VEARTPMKLVAEQRMKDFYENLCNIQKNCKIDSLKVVDNNFEELLLK
jgi:hypothetical protein